MSFVSCLFNFCICNCIHLIALRLDKLRDRTRNVFRKQPHYGGDGVGSSGLAKAHRIVDKTEQAVHRGTHEVSKATHSGISKANKTAHQIEKESKSFWKKVTK